jgi:hypothetical protein
LSEYAAAFSAEGHAPTIAAEAFARRFSAPNFVQQFVKDLPQSPQNFLAAGLSLPAFLTTHRLTNRPCDSDLVYHPEGDGDYRRRPRCRSLRILLMTSFAFIFGVIPRVIATGAGAEMSQALGTVVFFGMIGVTLFGVFLTPVFYTVIRRLTGDRPVSADRPVRTVSAYAANGRQTSSHDLRRLGRTFGSESSLDYLAALAMAASSAEVSAAEFTAMNSGAGETVA